MMMKTTIKTVKFCVLLLAMITSFSSCTEDLNITPQDDQTLLGEDLFKNETAYKELLGGVYANLSLTGIDGPGSSTIQGLDAGTSQFGRVLLYLQTLSADQMIWSYENDPGTREIQRNIWTAQNPLLTGMFGRTHNTISYANNFLRETTDAKLDARNVSTTTRADIVTYRAEARLLRALSYYYMMDIFGKAAFITEDTALNSYPIQYDRAQLFAFIVAELKDIDANLKDPMQNEHGRADKAVAWMILAKIYLNAEVYINTDHYADCLSYTEKIIGGGFSLATDYGHNFMADNNTNSAVNEIIFPLISDGIYTHNYGPTTVMINGEVGSIEANGVQLFDGATFSSDTRNTIISGTRNIEITDISDRDAGYITTKWSNATSTGGFGSNETFVDTDFPLFRLADVYLMYAEAHLRGGGGTATIAAGYLTDIRTRSNNTNTISTADLSLDFILDERSRELYWEAHRRQDLIRFNKFTGGNYNWTWKGNGSNGISLPSHFDVYPIPSSSLSSNPNLTQNTGY